jgi:hypothetical protein
MELLTTVLIGLALVEIYAWLPRVCMWIVELAIRLLPPGQRERWREEFQEGQSALPQSAWRLVHAISLCSCALSMRRSLAVARAEDQFERADKGMALIFSQHRAAETKLHDIASAIAESRSQIITWQAQAQSRLRLQTLSSQNAQAVANDVLKSAAALGIFAETIGKAHDRAMNLCAAQTDMISKALNDAEPLINRVGRSWKFARRVRPIAHKVPIFGPIVVTLALSVALRDFKRLCSYLESYGLIDKKALEEALEEVRNISLAIQQAGKISPVDQNSGARLSATTIAEDRTTR